MHDLLCSYYWIFISDSGVRWSDLRLKPMVKAIEKIQMVIPQYFLLWNRIWKLKCTYFFSDHKWCGNSDRFAGNGKNIGWKYGCYVPNCRKKLDNSWFFPLLQSTSTNLWKMQSQQRGQCGYLYSSVSKVLYSRDNLYWVQQNCQ